MGRPRINPIHIPRDELHRQGKRNGDVTKKFKYSVKIINDGTSAIGDEYFTTMQNIAIHYGLTRNVVEYILRKNKNEPFGKRKEFLKNYEIIKL